MNIRNGGWLAIAVCVIITLSCNHPDNIGLEILPEGDLIDVYTTDTLSMVARTVRVDSLIGSNTSVSMLGSYGDFEFGSSLAQHYVQLRLSNPNVDFTGITQCDSITLRVNIFDFYGESNTMQNISVYELDDEMNVDSIYYTNQNFSATTLVGKESVKFNPNDSVTYDSLRLAPQMRIKLDNAFGDRLLALPTEAYESSENFLEHVNGIFLTAERIKNHNTGGMAMLNYGSGDTRMRLYYNDSLSFDFIVTSSSSRHTTYEHGYEAAPVGMALTNPLSGRDKVYIHSMAGLKTRIFIPYLSFMRALGPISINQAEVTFPIAENSDEHYAPHERLALVASDEDGIDVTIPDLLESSSYYGGEYDEIEKEYRFNIARHVQQIVRGTRIDYGLVLVASGGVVNGNRTVLKGTKPIGGGGMKIELIYSLVD